MCPAYLIISRMYADSKAMKCPGGKRTLGELS
jgi:hypothetical protein